MKTSQARLTNLMNERSSAQKDFEELLKKLGTLIVQNQHLMKIAIHNGFDVNWLIRAEIPENIDDIHRDLKKRGYLN